MAKVRPRHLPLVARMAFWRVALPVAKRFVTAERLVRFLAAPGNRARSTRDEEMAVRLAGRLWRSSEGPCLERSLALYHELGRLGAHPELVLGIGQEGDDVIGHAWVEVDGRHVLELKEPKHFAGLARFADKGVRAEKPRAR